MNNPDTSQDPNLDRQLADFTDAFLEDKEAERSMENAELAELQDTVRKVRAAVKAARPDTEMNARIRKRLQDEWKNTRTPRTFFWQQPRLILVAGLTVIALAAASLLLNPGEQLTGAATETLAVIPLLLGSVIILILIIYWLIRHSKRN